MENKDDYLEKLTSVAEVLDGIHHDKDCVPKGSEYIVTLLETYLFSQLALMELMAYDNSCKNANSTIEKNTAISYFDLAIGEGITYLCGYGLNEKNTKLAGIRKMPDCEHKNRLISVFEDFKQFCDEFNLTTGEFKLAKEYTKHYWSDPLESIRHLMNINNDAETYRANSYILTLLEISTCIEDFFNSQPVIRLQTNKVVGERNLKCPIVTEDNSNLNYLERIKVDESIISRLWESVKMLDKTKILGKAGILTKSNAISLSSEITSLIEFSTPVWHIRKMSLDISYALKSYFNAQNHLERQSGTYRMLISLYGGFSRLYGISEDERRASLLANYHKIISDCYDNTLSAQERKLKRDLKNFGIELKDKFEQIRHTLIHSRSSNKRKDLVLEKYYLMCELCPTEVFDYVVRFANIVHPLRDMTDAVLAHHYPEIWKRYNS